MMMSEEYKPRCPFMDCSYEADWVDSVDKASEQLDHHLYTEHSNSQMASYIANMIKEDGYDAHDDSRPYYLTKHVSE